MSPLKINPAKKVLREGKVAIGTMVASVRSPQIVSMLAAAGWDFYILDAEHNQFGWETMTVFIGPYDLSKTLGIAGQTKHPLMVECFEKVIAACRKHGVAPGVHLQDMGQAKEWIAKGMRFVGLKTDARFLMESMTAATRELK